MSPARSVVSAALLAALVVLAPGDAGAQGGILGRVKKKAAEKVAEKVGARPEARPDSAKPAAERPDRDRQGRPTFGQAAQMRANGNVPLEMSAETLDRLQKGLDAEAKEIRWIASEPERLEKFEQCRIKLATDGDPTVKKLLDELGAAGEKNDMAASQRIAQEMHQYSAQKCGFETDTTDVRIAKHLRPLAKALNASGLTREQYALLKERVPPFCTMAASSGDEMVRVPGTGQNVYWVYSAAEVQALRPRCAALTKALAAVS